MGVRILQVALADCVQVHHAYLYRVSWKQIQI